MTMPKAVCVSGAVIVWLLSLMTVYHMGYRSHQQRFMAYFTQAGTFYINDKACAGIFLTPASGGIYTQHRFVGHFECPGKPNELKFLSFGVNP